MSDYNYDCQRHDNISLSSGLDKECPECGTTIEWRYEPDSMKMKGSCGSDNHYHCLNPRKVDYIFEEEYYE